MTSIAHETRAHQVRAGRVGMTRPTGMAMVGFLTLLTGAWGGIVAFVGPVWGYHASGTDSWVWNANHWLLHLIPGAVAVVAGLLMMGQAPARRAAFRAPFFVSGVMAAGAGAWFILGPEVWPMVYSGPVYGPSTSHLTAFLNALGANLGPGILLSIFGGMALKSLLRDREVPLPAGEPVVAGTAAGAGPMAAGAGPAAGAGATAERPMVRGAAQPENRPMAGNAVPGGAATAERPGAYGGEMAADRTQAPGQTMAPGSQGAAATPPETTVRDEERAGRETPEA